MHTYADRLATGRPIAGQYRKRMIAPPHLQLSAPLVLCRGISYSKGRKKGYDEYEIVLILEQNIRVFLGLHKLTHGLTFGIIYFCKYYGQ